MSIIKDFLHVLYIFDFQCFPHSEMFSGSDSLRHSKYVLKYSFLLIGKCFPLKKKNTSTFFSIFDPANILEYTLKSFKFIFSK